jgi:hypothetical protein
MVWIRVQIGSVFSNRLDPDPHISKIHGFGFREYRYEKLVEVKLTRNCVQNVLLKPVDGAAGVTSADHISIQ